MTTTINASTSAGLVQTADTSGSLALQTANTTAVTIDTSQNVGIGTTSPASLLHVDNGAITAQRYGSSGALVLRSAAGTQASPTAIASSTSISTIVGRGYDGTAYRDIGTINMVSDGAISSVSSPGYIAINTTPSGSVTTVERMRIDSSGNLLVGTTSNITGGKVNIAQGSSDGTMYQMMQFTAGSGTGGNEVGQIKRQTTASVANSATTILNSMTFGELITVAGTGSGAIFADLLMASYNTVAVISSNTQQGGPASRTYSVSSGALRLTMGSATAMSITVQSLISGAKGA